MIPSLYVLLTGHVAIRVDRGSGRLQVIEWYGGDVTGFLPYSRLTGAPGTSTAEETTEVLALHRDHFPELISSCHELTALLVHVMLDRARRFTSADLQTEKLISLGRLSAGLAHELNNPASAVARSAEELSGCLFELEASALALGAAGLTSEQLGVLSEVRKRCSEPDPSVALGPMERADREDEVGDWMAGHGLRGELVVGVAETPLSVAGLEGLERATRDESRGHSMHAVDTDRVRSLATDVRMSARRVHDLVKSVKGFAHMGQQASKKPVDIRQGLTDTLAVLRGKARQKSVSLTLEAADDLPLIDGFGGELNQVWQNLIDNAIDATPPEGHVSVSAARKDGGVVVRVTDDGPGVPEKLKDRIFEPFFTTKPQGEGTGLGLDIVRRLVRVHNGLIEVASRPGCTEFRVILPGT